MLAATISYAHTGWRTPDRAFHRLRCIVLERSGSFSNRVELANRSREVTQPAEITNLLLHVRGEIFFFIYVAAKRSKFFNISPKRKYRIINVHLSLMRRKSIANYKLSQVILTTLFSCVYFFKETRATLIFLVPIIHIYLLKLFVILFTLTIEQN